MRSGDITASAMPLRRVLVEVEPGGAERQVEIGDHGIEVHVACDRPGDVVRDRGSADAALGADDRERASDRLRVGAWNRPEIARMRSTGPTGAIR